MSDPQILVKTPEGVSATVPVDSAGGPTVRQALDAIRAAGGTVKGMVLAAKVDGALRDLSAPLSDGSTVEPVVADSEEGRSVLRHSVAHVMAQAVTDLFPGAKFAIGPPITDGFYYDFDVERPFTPEDLERIAARMAEIIREDQPFQRREVQRDEALELFADQPYKRAIIEGIVGDGEVLADATAPRPGEAMSVYENLRADGTVWPDLCRGPHIPTTRWVPAFKLQRVAGAYWRGDERQPMLQRIYGTAWESRKALESHLERLEQARQRDHRKLGRELDLLSFPEELGAGLAVWHPNGSIVRKEMEDYARAEHVRRGYQPVYTPHLGKSLLWETSGHLDFYADSMYPPMELDVSAQGQQATAGTNYYPKPMNCPFHVLIYRSRTRSYRELPLRLFELGTVYRYERSGVVHGLLRARGFTQDDSHIFCTADQIVDEIEGCLRFAIDLFDDFGFAEGPSRVALSTRPAKADTVGTDEGWVHAEAALRAGLDRSGLDYVVDEGEGAFYGPKIDLQITDAIGRAWQLTTVQVDFNLPERFGLSYVGPDGAEHQPYMVHRALFGSLDRFFAILLEHYAGAFPTWLAPVQAVVVPIADRHLEYGREVVETLSARGARAQLDDSHDTMGAKIRKHQLAKVPYQLVVGDAEVGDRTVSVRPREGAQRKGLAMAVFADELADAAAPRRRAGATS
ncbi:MAG: threonine--tRNA ligase [Nitriliruptorales bacterium]|nr:threonine--tRNA ligase [Nitriliruptorales bacterium]